MQSKSMSWIEVTSSTLFGYIIALLATAIILPLFGFNSSSAQNAKIALLFTVISIIRGYIFRRLFNWIAHR